MKKRILIPWSGGVDSTVLMYEAIKAGHRVSHVHLEAGQPEAAHLVEARRLGPLKSELMRIIGVEMGTTPYHYPAQVSCAAFVKMGNTNMPYKQLPSWFIMLMSMLADRNGVALYDEVHLGYVLNDDAAPAFNSLTKAWHYLAKAIYSDTFTPPVLMAPAISTRKSHLIARLETLMLLPYVWYCELPQPGVTDPEPCGYCPSCVRHRRAVEDNHLDREYGSRFTNLLKRSNQLTQLERNDQ